MTSFYSADELAGLGLGAYGEDVRISRHARLYAPEKIRLGSHVRIDDFCVLSGAITIGSYVHLAVSCVLFAGDAAITIGDYSTLSSRCAVYATTDDYSGEHMCNPMVPERYTGVTGAAVTIGRHVIVGTGSTILPGVTLAEGCAAGAMSLLNRSTEPWGIYYGVPARRREERSRKLLDLCAQWEAEQRITTGENIHERDH